MPLGRKVGLDPSDVVLDGDPAPPPQKEQSPTVFGPFYCPKTAGCIKMPLGIEVGLNTSGIVLDGTQLPSPKKGAEQPILAYVYYDQMSAWNKMPLCMDVGLSPGHIVLYGDPAPIHPQTGKPLNFFSAHVCCGQTAAWVKMRLNVEGGLISGHIGSSFSSSKRGRHSPNPNFWFMLVVVKRLDGSRCHLVWS